MRSKQSHINRTTARENGDTYYHGLPCGHCGETRRYTVNARCVICNNTRYKEQLKEYHKSEQWKQYQHDYHQEYRNAPENQERLELIRDRYNAKKQGITLEEYQERKEVRKERILRRKRARCAGDKYYDDPKPCKHCETTLRYTASRTCVQCGRNKYKPVT